MSEPLSAAESSVDVLNSESSHTLDYNSEGRDISIFIMVLYKIQGEKFVDSYFASACYNTEPCR